MLNPDLTALMSDVLLKVTPLVGPVYREHGSLLVLRTEPVLTCPVFQDNRVHIGPKMEIRVVTLGLDGAGKTTILFKLKQDEFMQPIPTIGSTTLRNHMLEL